MVKCTFRYKKGQGGQLPKAQDGKENITYLPDRGGYQVPVDLETGNIKGGILPEVIVSGKATPLVRHKRAYETNNPYDAQQYATDLFNNPKSREEYFDRFNKDRFFQKYGQRGYNEFQDNAWKYAAEQRMSQLPQGNRSRIEYLNDLTAKEEELFKKYNPALQTTYSTDFVRAVNAKDRESYDQLKNKLYNGPEKDLYTEREKQNMLQNYKYIGGVHGGDALAPLTWMSKPIQSIYRDDYSGYDALVGRKNDATIVEDIFTDPTLIYGLGKTGFNLGVKGLRQIGKYATTNTPLRNAYKLNPLANRAPLYSKLPQVDEPIRNVITGEATKIKNISNQVEAYTLKNGANPDVIYDAMKGSKFADDLVKDGRFEVNPELTQKFYGNNTQYANIGMTSDVTGKGELPISFKSLYEGGYRDKNIVHGKPHWLRGYEPIKEQEVLKQLPGSPNTGITSNVDDLVDLYRIQEKSGKTFAQLAAENKIPKAFNTPKVLAQKANEEKYFGQWFTKDKADLDWYMKDREFVDPEIINLKVPKSKLKGYSNYDKSLSRAPDREFVIPLNEQGLYKQPNTSNAASSIDNVGRGFKSEINWGAWNKEIPQNKPLMDEYLAIEQKAKADGTWMKNPDGSEAFLPDGRKPSPELWIQSQSKNWEKAYGYKGFGNIDNTYRGVGISNTNPDFSVSRSPNLSGDRGIFTGNYDLARNYAFGVNNPKILTPFSSRKEPGVFHLIHPKGKQIDYNTMLSDWTDVNLVKGKSKLNLETNLAATKSHYNKLKNIPDVNPELLKAQEKRILELENYINNFDNIITDKVEFDKMRAALGDITSTDDIAEYIASTNLNKIKLRNIIDGDLGDVTIVNNKPGNYLKSAIGNNGMFDMTNPNIYKSVAPLVGAGVVGSQYFSNPQEQVEYRDGGSLPKAQDNLPTDKYGNPIRARIIEEDGARTYYDDRTNTIVLNNDYDAMTPEEKKNVIAHENFHGFQFRNGMSTYLGDGAPIVRPPMMSTDEHYYKYHNRKPTETDIDADNFIRANSDFRFVPRDLIFDKIDEKNVQYNNPHSMEGQATYYENTGQIFPFKDGGSLPKYLYGGRLPMYQDGRTVSEIYEKITGLPWSTAKERGLTDGSYDANIKLRNQLLSQPLTQNPISYQNAPVIEASSFGEAFSNARNLLGANRVFEYNGKQYATNVEGETGVVRTTGNTVTTVPTSTTGTTVNSGATVNQGTTGTATNNTPSQSTQVAPIVLAPNKPERLSPKERETNNKPRYNEVSRNINPNSKLDPLNKPTSQDFRESVYNHYNTILKKNNGQFIHSTQIPYEGALNCINGVCSFYKEASPNIMERPYIGNLTFNDNAEREGWYLVDTDKNYEVLTGDMIRFTQPAWKYAESRQGQPGIDLMMESFEKNPETKNYPKVGHTSGVIKNSDGTYTILNNKGKVDLLAENVDLEGINKLVKEGRGGYDAAQIWRYDPAYIEKQKLLADTQTKDKRNRTISYLKNFKKEPSFANKNIRPNIQPIIDAYVPMRRNLVANYGESDEFIDKAFQNLIGVAGQESNYDNRLVIQENIFYKAGDYAKQEILDSLSEFGNTLAKYTQNLFLTDDKEYEINDDVPQWKRQKEFELLKAENFKNLNPEELKSDEQIWHDVFTKYGKVSADSPLSTKSKGMFKQKDVSKKFAKNYNTDNWQYTQEGQIKNALGLYIQNFEKAKRLFPDDNEEIWHKIATIAHNSPKSAYNKEYVDYFIKGIDNPAGSKSHYLSEVDRYRRIAFNDYSDYNNASSNDLQQVINMEPPLYYEQPSSTRVNINTYLNDLPPSQTMNILFPATIGNNIPPQNTQRMPIGLPSTSQTINTSNKLLPGQQQAQPPIFQDGGGCCGNKGGSNLQYLPEYLYGGRLPMYQDGYTPFWSENYFKDSDGNIIKYRTDLKGKRPLKNIEQKVKIDGKRHWVDFNFKKEYPEEFADFKQSYKDSKKSDKLSNKYQNKYTGKSPYKPSKEFLEQLKTQASWVEGDGNPKYDTDILAEIITRDTIGKAQVDTTSKKDWKKYSKLEANPHKIAAPWVDEIVRKGNPLPKYQDGDIKVPERKGVRKNPDGSESTHLMATETFDGDNWFSFPTLFQNEDGTWVDMSDRPWEEAYEEAKKRGEVIDFGKDKEAAIEFGEGSWKLPNYQEGGIPKRYKNMGFNKVGAKKKSTRSGKKWMVLAKKGDKYKVVHGGDSNMKDFSQHGSKDRKEKFWSRMGGRNSAKAKDPFSPLYWHKRFGTWQEGGDIQQQGYKDTSPYRDNPYIDIYANPSTDSVNITTYGMSMDLKATPYYPNGEVGEPTILAGNSGNYNFEGASWVREEPAKGLLISEKGSKKVLDFFG